jgi:hypothetical protein
MADLFKTNARSLTAPASDAFDIVPDDLGNLPTAPRGVFVGLGGDMSVEMLDGTSVIFSNLQPGMFYPFRLKRVFATGTTAGNLIGLV